MQALGFAQGYGEHHYDADRNLRRRMEPSELNPRPEEVSKTIIEARTKGMYEAGRRHRARQRVDEIQSGDGMVEFTLSEAHENDHFDELHPCQQEITGIYGAPFGIPVLFYESAA